MTSENSSFWNGTPARLMFAALAVVLAVFAWFQYQNIGEIRMERSDIQTPSQLQAAGMAKAVDQCREKRFAQIDQMVADGFLDASQVDSERESAASLCIVTERRNAPVQGN